MVPVGGTPERVARILTDQFFKELPPDAAAKAKKLGLTVPQVITLASLIEREAQADDERPLMAGVYYNRLHAGMPLEVDATIEYVFPEHHTVITRRDLAIDSPYNTYRHVGLPPTPIANPGKASIDAAFAPQASAYLFYVYKGNGHHAFAQNARRAQRQRRTVPALRRSIIDNSNGAGEGAEDEEASGPLELRDVLVIETNDGQSLEFEVVGLVEDDENNAYAVCYSEGADEFVVTDNVGTLLDDDELAQEILDDFFVLAEEGAPETEPGK